MASSQLQRESLLRRMPPALNVPPVVYQPGVEKLDSPITMEDEVVFTPPTFTTARYDAQKRKMPQCIAHRGFKAKFPENTMAAFRGAVRVGVHALETDLHITKDEVVVISHDATLKRCFGRPDKIIDRTWDEIKDLTTTAEPHEHMPRLLDLLEYLAEPGMEEIWLLLDIKLDNDAKDIMRLIGSTLKSASPAASRAWKDRIVLGIWAAKYLPLAQEHLPGYPVMHIGFSTTYARHFFKIPHVGFNMLLPVLVAPGGSSFLRDARETYHRQVLAWTVNTEDRMDWCIRRKLDGVITDDPPLFLKTCEEWREERVVKIGWRGLFDIYRMWAWIWVMMILFRKKLGPVAGRELIQQKPKA